MSKYTTEVRFLCESAAGKTESKGFSSIAEILSVAAPRVFNFTFPIFDESYRLPLEIKILRHYYTREICEETVGLWKLRLQDKLNIIMPYYNKLYESELIKFNPLYDTDLTREHSVISQGENSREEFGNTVSNESIASEKKQNTESETTNSSSESVASDKKQNTESETTNSSNNNSVREGSTFENKQNTNTSSVTYNDNTSSSNTNTNNSSTESDNEKNGTVTLNKNDTKKDKYSDTPQGSIQNIENDTYLTNARIINDTGEDTTTTNETTHTETTGWISDSGSSNQEKTGSASENKIDSSSLSAGENISDTSENNSVGKGSQIVNESVNNISETNAVGSDSQSVNENISKTKSNNININKSNIGNVTNTEEYVEHVVGKRGSISNSKMLIEFRDTFLNIDKMIIDELSTLFFGLW